MLRQVEETDLDMLRDWADDPDIRPNLRWTGPLARGPGTDFADTLLDRTNNLAFVIEVEGKDIGCVLLTGIEHEHGTSDLSIWLRPAAHGRGYAREASALIIEHAFDALRLQRLQALTYEYNMPAHNILDALGFEKEGTLRHSVYHDGEYYDCYVYGLLADEFTGHPEIKSDEENPTSD